MDARTAIGAAARRKDLFNLACELHILGGTRTGRRVVPGILATAGDLQDAADERRDEYIICLMI